MENEMENETHNVIVYNNYSSPVSPPLIKFQNPGTVLQKAPMHNVYMGDIPQIVGVVINSKHT